MARQIHHIGYVVENLEAAIEKWEAVTGFTFTPICHFRSKNWVDNGVEGPQEHDARVAFTRQGPPFIELTAIHGSGSDSPHIHSIEQGEGYHHLAFMNEGTPEECLAELGRLGVESNGVALDENDRPLFFFTDKKDLGGARLEMCFPGEQLLVREDNGQILDFEVGFN